MKKSLIKVWKRSKNKKVFVAVASGILLILVNLGVIDIEMSSKIQGIVDTLLTVGVAVGIFSNPDSHEKTE